MTDPVVSTLLFGLIMHREAPSRNRADRTEPPQHSHKWDAGKQLSRVSERAGMVPVRGWMA
jgi:hypothetical protein